MSNHEKLARALNYIQAAKMGIPLHQNVIISILETLVSIELSRISWRELRNENDSTDSSVLKFDNSPVKGQSGKE